MVDFRPISENLQKFECCWLWGHKDKWSILGNDPCAISVPDKCLLQGVACKRYELSLMVGWGGWRWMLKMHPFPFVVSPASYQRIIKLPQTPYDFIKRKLIYVIVILRFEWNTSLMLENASHLHISSWSNQMSKPGLKASKNLVYPWNFLHGPSWGWVNIWNLSSSNYFTNQYSNFFLATEAECSLVYHIQRDFLPKSLFPNP